MPARINYLWKPVKNISHIKSLSARCIWNLPNRAAGHFTLV